MGLDPGTRRIGVAVSDPGGVIASPHAVLERHRNVVTHIVDLVETLEVGTIVVGLPVSLSGDEGEAAEAARAFGAEVAAATGCDVVYWDERFTTVQAEAALISAGMRRRERRDTRDKVAAAVLLQSYLDRTQDQPAP